MKCVLIAFLAVMMAGLGSGEGVGLPLSNRMRLSPSAAPRQVVFVDRVELARLHPSWQALSDMRMMLSKAGSKAAGITRPSGTGRSTSRTELAARAAVKADKALDELQARKFEALRVRSDAMRAQKMQSAEMDWKADVRGVQQDAAAKTGVLDERNSAELVNARLKSMAAEAASKIAAKEGSGLDRVVAEDTLKNAEARLAAVAGADESEKKAIASAAADKIAALKDASAKRVEQEIQSYEDEQSKLIRTGIALAKDDIARQMGPEAMVIARSRMAQDAAAGLADGSVRPTQSIHDLQAAVVALQARIEKDVDAAVRHLAASNGMAVVFQRRKSAPDATRTFAGLIKKRGWNAYGPVMGGVGSS